MPTIKITTIIYLIFSKILNKAMTAINCSPIASNATTRSAKEGPKMTRTSIANIDTTIMSAMMTVCYVSLFLLPSY